MLDGSETESNNKNFGVFARNYNFVKQGISQSMVKFWRIERVSKIDIPEANWPVYNEELMLKITICFLI